MSVATQEDLVALLILSIVVACAWLALRVVWFVLRQLFGGCGGSGAVGGGGVELSRGQLEQIGRKRVDRFVETETGGGQ